MKLQELQALARPDAVIRLPAQTNVPLTDRVGALIDTPAFNRLRRITQLGVVSLVYPGAQHTRFEHCLGVYYLTLRYLRQLSREARGVLDDRHGALLVVGALLHDIGHLPFGHILEDMEVAPIPSHERRAEQLVASRPVASVLRRRWGIRPAEVLALASAPRPRGKAERLMRSVLSGPIDVDKMDYLARDSLHCGVPYGLHFDRERLIASLVLNARGDGLAISEKGKTAAELMVFARYVMFAEVYWHHAVRAASVMVQRAVYDGMKQLDVPFLLGLTEAEFVRYVSEQGGAASTTQLMSGVFGPERRLYKRVLELAKFQGDPLYERLARRPFAWLVACARNLARRLRRRLRRPDIADHHILIDAPPPRTEVQFDVSVHLRAQRRYVPLAELSPVVRALAVEQFDDYVKRVRVLCEPGLVSRLARVRHLRRIVEDAVAETDA